MKLFLKAVCCVLLWTVSALTQEPQVRVGAIEFYGYKGIDLAPIRGRLPVREGVTFPMNSMGDMKRQIKQTVKDVTGYEPAKVPMTCCDADGNWNIFILLNGRNNEALRYNPTPEGNVRLPATAIGIVERARAALLPAVKNHSTEDTSKGYSLSSDATLRAAELEMHEYAMRNPSLIINVLKSSSSAEDRRAAAQLLGYADQSESQLKNLSSASFDPDSAVRNDALRALVVLAFSNSQTAAKIATKITLTRFIAMLNSPEWTDRNKALGLFHAVTASRDPGMLGKLRALGVDSLLEMAKWKDLGYANPAGMILLRIAGRKEPASQALARSDLDVIVDLFSKTQQ